LFASRQRGMKLAERSRSFAPMAECDLDVPFSREIVSQLDIVGRVADFQRRNSQALGNKISLEADNRGLL
jgi:hypothetical protein